MKYILMMGVFLLSGSVFAKDVKETKEAAGKRKPNQACTTNLVSEKQFIMAVLKADDYAQGVQSVAFEAKEPKHLVKITYVDGNSRAYDAWQECNGKASVARQGQEPVKFVCKEWVNCMPIVSEEAAPYCTDNYKKWSKANCKKEAQFTY